uniref:Zgc:112980 n=1 Tax=Astyanax mexicanus TaxID=7994 RepID=W5K9Z4_ASTMX
MALNASVIVLSDSDDDDNNCTTGLDDSVLIIEESERNRAVPEVPKSSEILDEDVTITYSQKAHVLPHARYDCTIPFCATEGVTLGPEENNADYCEQCFCYVCDEPACKCKFWTVPGFCHCNAHKRSVHWKSLRDKNILGYLSELSFPFSPQDMDSDLQRAEASLQQFACSLAYQYTAYLADFQNINQTICPHSTDGRRAECRTCNEQKQKSIQNSYLGVMEHVFTYLDEAMKHTPKTCVVMLLGAVKLFISHRAPGNSHLAGVVSDVVMSLLWRVTSRVQTLFVNSNFPASFTKQLQQFFLALPFPPECRWLKNSLNVLPWDDPLLSSVLKGQNVTGERHTKGKKTEILFESIVVILARVSMLQQQNKYRELARYLKVVKSDSTAVLQIMKDWIPLCLCKVGNFAGAVDALLSSKSGSSLAASRLSQPQFAAYLRILTSGQVPTPRPPQLDFTPRSGVILKSQPDPLLSTDWTPVGGEFNPLSRLEVLKFVLRVLNCNTGVFTHPESWVKFMNMASASSAGPDGVKDGVALAEPDINFLLRTREIADNILTELTRSARVQIPKTFQADYPDQALLLLATQALATRILHARLCPILKVIMTFQLNPWALRWLFYSLTVRSGVLDDLLCVVVEELMKEPQNACLPKEDRLGQSFIASFLCLFFLERSVILDPHEYPARTLLAGWNESHYPWQHFLRKQLEFNVALLTPDKQRILHMIRQNLQ